MQMQTPGASASGQASHSRSRSGLGDRVADAPNRILVRDLDLADAAVGDFKSPEEALAERKVIVAPFE